MSRGLKRGPQGPCPPRADLAHFKLSFSRPMLRRSRLRRWLREIDSRVSQPIVMYPP